MSSIGSYSSLPFAAFANTGSGLASEAAEPENKPAEEAIGAASETDSNSEAGSASDRSEQAEGAVTAGENAPNGETLTEEELKQIRKLKARDRKVRAHEQAHLAAAGQHAVAVRRASIR